jgi:hypothetical protein
LAVTLPCSDASACRVLHRDDEPREVAPSGATSATTGQDDPEQRHRLGHAFEFLAAALLGNEQARRLTLHSRRHHDCTRLCQGLCPDGEV